MLTPREQLINKLEATRHWYSLTIYSQSIYRVRIGPIVIGCIAGLCPGSGTFDTTLHGAEFLNLKSPYPELFNDPYNWPHAYQTLYRHDKVEAAKQAILAVDEYGNFPHAAIRPGYVRLFPAIMESLGHQIDEINQEELWTVSCSSRVKQL